MAEKLAEANSTAFTVCFTCKVNEADIMARLASVKAAAMKDSAQAKALAKELLVGKESTIVGRLSNAEGRMGRSLVIDLPTGGYRQVDHRTLKYLIIKNVKYTVKK